MADRPAPNLPAATGGIDFGVGLAMGLSFTVFWSGSSSIRSEDAAAIKSNLLRRQPLRTGPMETSKSLDESDFRKAERRSGGAPSSPPLLPPRRASRRFPSSSSVSLFFRSTLYEPSGFRSARRPARLTLAGPWDSSESVDDALLVRVGGLAAPTDESEEFLSFDFEKPSADAEDEIFNLRLDLDFPFLSPSNFSDNKPLRWPAGTCFFFLDFGTKSSSSSVDDNGDKGKAGNSSIGSFSGCGDDERFPLCICSNIWAFWETGDNGTVLRVRERGETGNADVDMATFWCFCWFSTLRRSLTEGFDTIGSGDVGGVPLLEILLFDVPWLERLRTDIAFSKKSLLLLVREVDMRRLESSLPKLHCDFDLVIICCSKKFFLSFVELDKTMVPSEADVSGMGTDDRAWTL
mmetsp:Transcript_15225/g.33322  ORF Transcript_15225/g.33322 Transcript_15225/m.33322 type:complete len:406 (-) Transcript_15225:1310-2527(-)